MTLRTFSVYLYSFFIMTVPAIFLPVVYLFRLLGLQKTADYMVSRNTLAWSKGSLFLAGVKYKVYGKENIPKHSDICIVSNHQSYFDIPFILGNIPKVIGFISKKELSKIPLLNLWMYVIRCPFIDRNDREKSMKIIDKRLAKTAKGQPMLIFPEGKRSKQQAMSSFRKGGLNIIIEADATILPITLWNTHKIYEASGSQISSTGAKLIVHKAFKPSELNMTKDEIIQYLENTINPLNQNID